MSRFTRFLIGVLLIPAAAAAGPVAAPAPVPAEDLWTQRPLRFPPFFWLERGEDRHFWMASLLYWDWREGDAAQKLFLPLFYYGREADRRWLVSLPFIAAYQRPGEDWWVAGPLYRSRDDRFARTALFPVYWQQSRAGGGRATALVPFLFYDYRNRDRSVIDQAWLLGWRRVRGASSRGVLGNYLWSHTPETSFHALFPVYWRARGLDTDTTIWGPLYDRRESPPDGKRRYRGFFPLGGWGGSVGARTVRSHYLFPFYYYSRSAERKFWLTLLASRETEGDRRRGHSGLYIYDEDSTQSSGGVFPLWYRSATKDGFGRSTQVLTFYTRREGEDRFQLMFPLYAHWSDPGGSRFLSWGVWRRRTEFLTADGRGTGVSGWAFLYHWASDPEGRRTRVFFPLYWDYRRPPDGGLDLLFPLYAHYRDGPLSLTATPLFLHAHRGDQDRWSWLFLYWKNDLDDRRTDLLFPLVYRERGPERRVWLTPLFWSRRGVRSREGAFPLGYWYAGREKARTVVLPFYGHSRSPERELNVWGLGYRLTGQDRLSYGVFPLWGRFRRGPERGGYLMPFYWATGDDKGNKTLVLPPLLTHVARRRTEAGKDMNMTYLLLGNVSKKGGEVSHGFFPLYQYVQEGEHRNFWAPRILPLAAWDRRPGFRRGYAFPCAWQRTPARDWDFVFPLWYNSRRYAVEGGTSPVRGDRVDSLRVLFPLYWQGGGPARHYTYLPPLYARLDDGPHRLRAVTPLGWSVDRANGSKFRLFFPLYWRVVTAPAPAVPSKDIVVAGPWYRVKSGPEENPVRTVGLAPFFSSSRSGTGRYFDILGGLYARDRRDGQVHRRFFYFFTTRHPSPAAIPARP